ncbi:hypothetical protein LUZ60_016352 [Juncus effusus]|nr:hypothetical protein LUZ60_016352 [Juncus effusus]
MDDDVQRENRRHETDHHYKQSQMQWMSNPQTSHHLKENMKIMSLIAERDSAFQEMSIALAEKKAALAERDMFFLQRDAAISDKNSALTQRDKALSALHHHQQQKQQQKQENHQYFHPELYNNNTTFNNNNNDIITNTNTASKSKWSKKESKTPTKKPKVTISIQNHQTSTRIRNQQQQDLGLNQLPFDFDDSTFPVPVCSCTGKYHQCYKWGDGGWQSSCCTLTVSAHPLPLTESKRHARMSGRKMSGGVFKRLVGKLVSEGWDLGVPVDLKDHWSRHGTNRYITIK